MDAALLSNTWVPHFIVTQIQVFFRIRTLCFGLVLRESLDRTSVIQEANLDKSIRLLCP